jgi:hypothetical protein
VKVLGESGSTRESWLTCGARRQTGLLFISSASAFARSLARSASSLWGTMTSALVLKRALTGRWSPVRSSEGEARETGLG